MTPQDLRIETIDTVEGCREHQRLQNMVWPSDPPFTQPSHLLVDLMVALARNGGLLLAAYAGDTMVGVLLGMPALRHGRLVHLSQMMGVHPDWRGRGIGERLKWRQRELVLAQGIDTVVWTYDPLEAINARLNLARLGGIVRTYHRDYYGAMEDALNRGIPSDRFTVEWRLDAPQVQHRAAGLVPPDHGADAPIALTSEEETGGLHRPASFVEPAGSAALVEIPARVQEIKRRSLDVALAWRMATRGAFERLFAAGYVASDLLRHDGRVFYYLEQSPPDDVSMSVSKLRAGPPRDERGRAAGSE